MQKLVFYIMFIYQINCQLIFNFKKKKYVQNLNQTLIEFLFNNQLDWNTKSKNTNINSTKNILFIYNKFKM